MTNAADATLKVGEKEITFPAVDAVEGSDGIGVARSSRRPAS